MSKISLNKPTSGFNLAAINQNFSRLETEFQDKVLYRNNPTGEPNQMEVALDMNGLSILNVDELNGVPVADLTNLYGYTQDALNAAIAAEASADNADISEANALASEQAASQSAATAAVYSSLGLGGASAFDLGSITDLVIIFPTDWGTI